MKFDNGDIVGFQLNFKNSTGEVIDISKRSKNDITIGVRCLDGDVLRLLKCNLVLIKKNSTKKCECDD